MQPRRLTRFLARRPLFLITTCTAGRRRVLADPRVHPVLRREWEALLTHHGWMAGRYIIMPDHVHAFIRETPAGGRSLSTAVGKWKEWTARRLIDAQLATSPVWQRGFFDQVIIGDDELRRAWRYVRENPVRAGLAASADDWPYAGSVHFETFRS